MLSRREFRRRIVEFPKPEGQLLIGGRFIYVYPDRTTEPMFQWSRLLPDQLNTAARLRAARQYRMAKFELRTARETRREAIYFV